MSSKYAVIKGVSIKKGDVIEVKFKPLDEVLDYYKEDQKRVHEVLEELSINYHFTTFRQGGIFVVGSINNKDGDSEMLVHNKHNKEFGFPHEVSILDHNNDNDKFYINEILIDSISVRDDVAEAYFSEKFQLSLLRVDGNLIINGVPVDGEDSKLIEILEKVISDLSIKAMFTTEED